MSDPLGQERAAALAQIEALTREFDEVVAASKASNADDEHDPEGSTIAFERAQVATLLQQAHRAREDLTSALQRAQQGAYGACERCGEPIGAGRLQARPDARTCIACAAAPSARR